jgi:hypothetical protein
MRRNGVSDDVPDEGWTTDEEPGSEASSVPHDDIMKRLLDYQRTLREGASPEEAAETVRSAVIAEPAVEPSIEPAEAEPEPIDEEEAGEQDAPGEPEPEEPSVGAQVEAPEAAAVVGVIAAAEPAESKVPVEEDVRAETSRPTPAAPGVGSGLESRVATLEGKLEDLGTRLAELRQSFQDMAIAADERLAAMEAEIDEVQGDLDAE